MVKLDARSPRARAILLRSAPAGAAPLAAKFVRRIRDAWRICRQPRLRIAGNKYASSKQMALRDLRSLWRISFFIKFGIL